MTSTFQEFKRSCKKRKVKLAKERELNVICDHELDLGLRSDISGTLMQFYKLNRYILWYFINAILLILITVCDYIGC